MCLFHYCFEMARILRLADIKRLGDRYVHPYLRYVNFYLLVVANALVLYDSLLLFTVVAISV